MGLISIVVVVVVTILVSIGIIKEKHYSYCIGIMAFGLVYSITMLGTYIVGSDIQGELSASRTALESGWNFTEATDINAITGINITSIVTGFVAPLLSRILHSNLIWVYKAILPLFLVAVPVIMYYAYEKQIGCKRAYYAALFFIIMPVYSLQLSQIVKSMVAEFMFALMILAMVSSWRWQYKGSVILLSTILATVSHYTIGMAMIAYLFGILIVRLITSHIGWRLWAIKRVPAILIVIVLLVSSGSFYIYYHYAYGGTVNQVIGNVFKWHGGAAVTEQVIEKTGQVVESVITPIIPISPTTTSTTNVYVPPVAPQKSYLYKQEYLVQVGIGLDFLQQPLEGKIFRIIQYLTQVLIVIGALWLLFRYKRYKFTAEFIAGIGCSFILLLVCVFAPLFSSIINMPRFYQISLFFLSPMLVLGCDMITNNKEAMV
jgi:uncharacterized membrane protein